ISITPTVLNQFKLLEQGGNILFPPNFSPENALKSAWLKLQTVEDRNKKKALDVCTQPSIANALLDMVVQGLTPAKNQCYFIVYGATLQLSRSYMGTVAVTKRLKEVKDVFANIIYKDDTFQYKINLENGLKEIVKHDQDFKNIDINKIEGAYCVVTRNDDSPTIIEVMNISQIKTAWGQGTAYASGKSKAHKNFTDEMAKKTVINRTCKMLFNTSDDSDSMIDAINRTTEAEYTNVEQVQETAQAEIEEKANIEEIDFAETAEPTEEEKEKIQEKEKAEAKNQLEF
ncbi:MAG: recombinase RecT, partial [Melioribacteraceae bacterium]|nr:recombinase RecT [Melioribacteraceae bacterium]